MNSSRKTAGKERLSAALLALAMALIPVGALAESLQDGVASVEEQVFTYEHDDMSVTFVNGGLLTTQDGEPALVIYYDFVNNSSKAESFIYSFAVTAYQDGIECDPAYSWDFAVAPDDAHTALLSVKDGASMRVAKYFRIHNTTSPVDVELSRMFSFGTQPMSMTLTLPDITVRSSAMVPDDSQEIVIEFTEDEAHSIASAALLEGKSPSQWLHDVAIAAAEGGK
ncbi:MAG: DUF5067 domain-containing protein [Candidatus Fimadaptatus sp.]|jgi:hypothetical protein